MRNWPEQVMALGIFVILTCLILMYYGQVNSAKIARCDDPEFVKNPQNVEWCENMKAKQ